MEQFLLAIYRKMSQNYISWTNSEPVKELSVCRSYLTFVFTAIMTSQVTAAEPPRPRPRPGPPQTVDIREPELVLAFSSRDQATRIEIIPRRAMGPTRYFILTRYPRRDVQQLRFVSGGNLAAGQATRFASVYKLSQADVIPIFDHLYFVDVLSTGVRLTRVTERVAQQYRPKARSRKITLTSSKEQLFWDKHTWLPGIIKIIRIDPPKKIGTSARAIVQVQPPSVRVPRGYRDRPKSITVTVATGDLLAAPQHNSYITINYDSYRVVNVVPPELLDKDNPRAGHLVGWIELAADPVKKKPAEAAIRDPG